MPIPTPPPPGANNGGYILLAYSNGTRTHKMRFHVAPFNQVSGTYNVAQGTENSVSQTVNNLMTNLKSFWTNAFTFSWAALYNYQSGVPVQIPLTASVASQVCVGGGTLNGFPDTFYCFNFKSTLLGRAKFFMIEPQSWGIQHGQSIGTGDATYGTLIAYLTGVNTGVVAHDGGKLVAPAHFTTGYNRKLRRRIGDA